MPEYDARLLAVQVVPTTVPGASDELAYPGGRGELVSFELEIANTTTHPLLLEPDAAGARTMSYPLHPLVELSIPETDGAKGEVSFPDLLDGNGVPSPSVFQSQALAPHARITGWASVVASLRAPELMYRRPADIWFYKTDHDPHYVGQIRLWK